MDSSLYPHIVALIEAYEKGLINSIRDNPTDTNAHVLYMSPLRNMEATLEVSETGFESSVFALTEEEEVEQELTEKALNFEEVKNEDAFYQECKIPGHHQETIRTEDGKTVVRPYAGERRDLNVFKRNSQPQLELRFGQKEGFRYKAGVYKNKRISEAFDNFLSGDDGKITIGSGKNAWKTNFGIEECLDCLIDIELDLLIPPIEWTFSLTKLLQQIRDLINQIKTAMDPTNVFNPFCQFLAAIKENGLCPKNLPALQLILPTLFGKYSFDLAKIRLSWTGLFGPLIRGVVGGLVSALENIPRLANPFFDCIINSLTNFNKWIKTYLMSIDKIANELGKGFLTLDKVITRMGSYYDMVAGNSSEEQKELMRDLQRRIEYLRDTSLNANEGASLSYQNYNYGSLAISYNNFVERFISSSFLQEVREETDDFDLDTAFRAFTLYAANEGVLIVEHENNLYAIDLENFLFAEGDRNNTTQIASDAPRIQNVNYEDYQKMIAYINDLQVVRVNDNYIFTNTTTSTPLQNQTNTERAFAAQARQYNREYISAKRDLEARENLFRGSSAGSVREPFTWFYDPNFENSEKASMVENSKRADPLFGDRFATAKYDAGALRKYELQGRLNYLPVEPSWFKEDWFDLGLNKSYQNSAMNFLIERQLIPTVKACKMYISNITQKVIATFKSLEKFMSEYVVTDLKIAGQILELLHIIRFIRTIYSFVKNDWSCKDVSENPSIANETLGNEPIVFRSETPSANGVVNIESQQRQLVVGTTNNKYSTVVDMTDCKNMFSKLNLNDFNLDAIYESMLNV